MLKIGQKVKVKGIRDTGNAPRSMSGRMLAGRVCTIFEYIHGNTHCLLAEENDGTGNKSGVNLYELELLPDTEKWTLRLKKGHEFLITASSESILELCEYIGDDHLDYCNKNT